jgi:GNAT superfamily N-acetyltransferase
VGAPAPGSGQTLIREAEPRDVAQLLELFRELAVYEHLDQGLVASEERIARALFGERPAAQALIAQRGQEIAGYAVFFPTFSTFLGAQGIWLEDLFVRPQHRKAGVGRALMAAVAARVRERGGERLEWAALDWNELALGFYTRLGATRMEDWITHRLVGAELERLADEGASPDGGQR